MSWELLFKVFFLNLKQTWVNSFVFNKIYSVFNILVKSIIIRILLGSLKKQWVIFARCLSYHCSPLSQIQQPKNMYYHPQFLSQESRSSSARWFWFELVMKLSEALSKQHSWYQRQLSGGRMALVIGAGKIELPNAEIHIFIHTFTLYNN